MYSTIRRLSRIIYIYIFLDLVDITEIWKRKEKESKIKGMLDHLSHSSAASPGKHSGNLPGPP